MIWPQSLGHPRRGDGCESINDIWDFTSAHACPTMTRQPHPTNFWLNYLLKCMRLHLDISPRNINSVWLSLILKRPCQEIRQRLPSAICQHHTRVALSSIPAFFSRWQLNSSAAHIPGTDVLPTYQTSKLDHPWATTIHRSLYRSITTSMNLDYSRPIMPLPMYWRFPPFIITSNWISCGEVVWGSMYCCTWSCGIAENIANNG